MSGTQTTAPAPGWYHDPTGIVRWWDGDGWTDGTLAPPLPPPPYVPRQGQDPKTMAMLANGGGIVGGWIVPLVIYLIDKGQNRFVRHHASEALNFQLTLLAVNLLMIPIFFVGFFGGFASFAAAPSGATPAFGGLFAGGFILFWVVLMGLAVANIAFSIVGMVKANKGEWYRYPVRIPFVRGYVPPEER